MRRLMKEAGMMPPTFDSDLGRNTFTTRILLHHFMPEEDVRWLASNRLLAELNDAQKTAIIFLREVGAIDNITYRQLSGVSAREASASLKKLENLGLLKMNGQGRNTYYTPSVELNEMYAANGATSISNNATTAPNNATPVSNNATSVPKDATSILATLPKEISLKINSLGKRVPLRTLEALTIELCTIRPFSIEELALLLQRTVSHIRNKVLPPLLSDGSVRFTIPEMRNHPNQKYTAVNHE